MQVLPFYLFMMQKAILKISFIQSLLKLGNDNNLWALLLFNLDDILQNRKFLMYQGYFTRPSFYGPNCVISKHLKFITFQPDKVCY